jgi:hypothetical protein
MVIAWLALSPMGFADLPVSLVSHLRGSADFGELRDVKVFWEESAFKVEAESAAQYAWAVIPPPPGGWSLARRAAVEAQISNTGDAPVGVMVWVVGNHGWDAVHDAATLAPGENRTFRCDLRAVFPDGTPKLNPGDVKHVQVMLFEPRTAHVPKGSAGRSETSFSPRITHRVGVEVRHLVATGALPEWTRPPGRLDVPPIETGAPGPGKRVRYELPGDENSGLHAILHLPGDWQEGKAYPVIVEFPGNIFFAPVCYSTGLPDQCVIGHGICKGMGAISVGLPFIDRERGRIMENGWGNADQTADYAVQMVELVCTRFGGDRRNIVLTGFSRGAIACGFIGLRNDRIARLWKGFHACQHYDGDGWNGATMKDALLRAERFRGSAVFQTDNSQAPFQPIMDRMGARVTWASSGLGFHSTAMFLDERPSTQNLRAWFWDLVRKDGE